LEVFVLLTALVLYEPPTVYVPSLELVVVNVLHILGAPNVNNRGKIFVSFSNTTRTPTRTQFGRHIIIRGQEAVGDFIHARYFAHRGNKAAV
jgi:hypothetical protein